MFRKQPTRLDAILLALLVTVLWSTSWILIKKGLPGVPPLTFAGLRYGLGFLILVPFIFSRQQRKSIENLTKKDWLLIVLFGILNIAITQSAQYLGLNLLPAVTVSLQLQ
jgi:drug/metabolite transporter (DMT)-like permease